MPAPRTTSDVESPVRERERNIVLNRNRRRQRIIPAAQAARNAGDRAGRRARRAPGVANVPRNRPRPGGANTGGARRATPTAPGVARAAGNALVNRIAGAINAARARALVNRAARRRRRAGR